MHFKLSHARAWRAPLLRGFAVAAISLGLVTLIGCDDDAKTKTAASAAPVEDLSPVPAPDSLVADVFVAQPEPTWKELRGLAGAGAALLPANYPILVTTLTGLPPTAASIIDTDLPVVGALVDVGEGNPGLVLGVHLRSGRELVAAVTKGADARFDAKRNDQTQVTMLSPKNPGNADPLGMGVLGNYLLVGTTSAALDEAGPYVVRSLSKQPAPKQPIVAVASEKALGGPIAKRIKAAWKKRREQLQELDLKARKARGGRAPDFGDPAAALLGIEGAVDDLVSILEGSQQAKLVVTPGDRHLEAELEVTPKASGEAKKLVSEMPTGDLALLKALPRGTSLALLTHSSPAGRLESAKATEDTFAKLLDSRLGEADRKRLQKVLTEIAKGRGNQLVFGLGRAAGSDEIALLVAADVSDAAELDKGIRDGRGLLGVKAFADPLGEFLGSIKTTVGKGKAADVTPAPDRIGFELKPKASSIPKGAKVEPKRFELLWRVQDDQLRAAIAKEAGPALSELVNAGEEKSLAAHAELAQQMRRSKLEVAFAVMFQPSRLVRSDSTAPGADSPVLLTLGRRGGLGLVRLDADQGALQALARMTMRR
ncbi:MAG: hypothetical protein KC766_20810 [Myxococcales bacterium]|nr:hypothetical protein [Myxococcales bacterium]